jgi:predicted nuclease of predicted toxin-antitoxin system
LRLLLDQNLSFRLIRHLSDLFPDTKHVRELGFGSADDESIWAYAKMHRLVIVSKDGDFHQRSLLYGAPPKIIWLRVGNCTTNEIASLLRNRAVEIDTFIHDVSAALFVIDW